MSPVKYLWKQGRKRVGLLGVFVDCTQVMRIDQCEFDIWGFGHKAGQVAQAL